MSDEVNLAVPFFSQRSNRVQNCVGQTVAWNTCNLTSLCMVLNYLGITDDTPDVLIEKFLEKNYKDGYTYWSSLQAACRDLYSIDKALVLYDEKSSSQDKFEHENLEKYLKAGFPIMFSFGILEKKVKKNKEDKEGVRKMSGHIAVLRGMTKNGDWILNDPWGDPANAHGLLESGDGIPGVYVARWQGADITAGKGSGDNAIISKSKIPNVCDNPPHAAMCILWSKQWSFFLRDVSGERIRFGDAAPAQTLSKIQDNLSSSLDFVLSDNGSIKLGLCLATAKGKGVYSCGPGRIIAIKNSTDIADNFILVMHSLPGNTGEKVFMLYRGLSYVELDKKIEEGIYNSENFVKTWYDQIISKIHTKAVIYDKGKGTGARHETGLPERGIAYLVPHDENVRKFAEHIEPGTMPTKKNCAKINDINNYKITDGNKILFKVKNSGTGTLETKEAEFANSNLIPQTVNDKEYFYYRAKLAQLLSGETVVFLGEDDDTISDPSGIPIETRATFKSIFLDILREVFPCIDSWGDEYDKYLDKIIDFYQEKIEQLEANGNSSEIEQLADDFITKCQLLCRKVLETPWTEQTAAFSYSDRWYKGAENGSFRGLKQVYESVYNLFQSVKSAYDFGVTWTMFEESVKYFYPANMDFFIEATSGTVLGEATNCTSVECFSGDNVFKNMDPGKILNIKNIYDKSSVVSELKRSEYIGDDDFKWLYFNYVRKREVEKFHNKFPLKDLDYVLQVPNYLWELSQKEQTKIEDNAIGNMECSKRERDENKSVIPILFGKVGKRMLKLLKKYNVPDSATEKIYFYNPVKMISYIYELHKEQADKL